MTVRVIHRKNGMYDVYDKTNGNWLFSRNSPDNVFVELSKYPCFRLFFVDETL